MIKRLFLLLLSFMLFFILFGSKSMAISAPNGQDYNYSVSYTNGSSNITLYNNYPFFVASDTMSFSNYRVLTIVEDTQGRKRVAMFNSTSGTYNVTSVNDYYSPPDSGQWIAPSSYGCYVLNNSIPNRNGSYSIAPADLSASGMQLFSTAQAGYEYYTTPQYDFDNPIYAVNIPVPVLDVTYVPAISMLGGLPQTNNVFTDINVEDNAAFKIQLAVKVTVADMVQIGLTNGTTTYKYLDWTEGTLSDIYSLEDLQDAENISISNSDLATVWDSLYNSLYDDSDFPVFSSSVPFWNSNSNAQKYLDAQSYYRNNMARQMPMYGTRLEVFARYFAIDGQDLYVGAWRHWNSAEPLNTEKVTDKYQDQQPFPGTENTNTNVDYDTSDDTYTTIGTQTGVYTDPYTQVVINQNVPNYPDYPTAVSYNHDNILLQFIETANQLPNFFGQFGDFLTDTFSFIDRSVWAIIGFGFMCSIVVMIVKIL